MQYIDIHAHDGAFENRDLSKYDHLGETMVEFNRDLTADNVSHCFISSVHALLKDLIEGNEVTFTDAETDPRLFAYVYYHPLRVEESISEIEKYKSHKKFIGFKSRPVIHQTEFDSDAYRPLVEAAAVIGMPILLHTWPINDAHAVAKMAKESKAKIIMVHACNDKYAEAMNIVKRYDNVFVEPVTSAVYPGKIREIINIVGYERLIFGSDYGLFSRSRILKTYEEANLSSVEEEAVYRNNAIRVFGL
ncbi:MAG: amidohydrolase family protein [Fibrobacteres bacterium]|nr:amidohydrolase family protein [Fibrobacterota bacterium]